MIRRPLSVTIISWLLIVAGTVGLAYHLREFKTLHPFPYDNLLVTSLRILAVACGVYMLRGRDWARRVAVLWIAFHVGVSVFHSWGEVAMHAVLLVVFAYLLFRPAARAYFSPQSGAPS